MPELESRPAAAEEDSRKSGKFSWWEFFKVAALPIVTLIVGYLFNASVDERQARDSYIRLYADIMGRREEADSALRKDMFQAILNSFISKNPKQPSREYYEQEIVNLEFLAHNFHESLDLAPLFRHVRRELARQPDPYEDLQQRLNVVAEDVVKEQLSVLSGRWAEGDIDLTTSPPIVFGEFTNSVARDSTDRPILCMSIDSTDEEKHYRLFKFFLLDFDPNRNEVEVDLKISRPLAKEECEDIVRSEADKLDKNFDTEALFKFGPFTFPMIENVHLSHSERCAVSVTEVVWDGKVAAVFRVAVSYFPASRASLKEKLYYDEVLHDLLKSRPVETKNK